MAHEHGTRRPNPYVLVALAALVLYAWGFTLQCGKAALPSGTNPSGFAYPVRVEGVRAGTPAELRFLVEGWALGDTLSIISADGHGQDAVLVAAQDWPVLAVTALSGACFWSVCFFVFVPRIRQPAVPLFFWILLLYGMAVVVGGVFHQRRVVSPGALFGLIQIVCLGLLPAIFLRMTLRFPRPAARTARRLAAERAVWLAAVGVVGWQAAAFGRYFAAPGPDRFAALVLPGKVADVFMLAVTLVGFAILVRRMAGFGSATEARQVRWLLWGFLVGTAPYLFLRTLPQLVGLTPPLPAGADRVLELAVPLSFVFAVVWEKLLDIDVIIRRSVLYSSLAAVVVGLMVIPSLVLTWSFGSLRPGPYRLALLAGGLAAGLAYHPLRRALGRLVDRTLFGLGHDAERLLAELEGMLRAAVAPADVAAAAHAVLAPGLNTDLVAIVGTEPDGPPGGSLVAAPETTDSPGIESGGFPRSWKARGAVLAARVGEDGTDTPWLVVGPAASGRRYLRSHLDVVAGCARICEVALERLRLVAEKAAESAARRHLDELNRIKSGFLSQVSHDLRTPVTSITWSARNLLDGLAGDLNADQRRYLASIRDASGHLDHLVSNLLELSRLEQPTIELPLTDFAVGPVVSEAVSAIRPNAGAEGVELVFPAPMSARVHAHPEKLVEVLVNILDNAIKYSPPEGRVRITTRCEDRWYRIAVADEGPGLGGLDDPFAQFSQGRTSPHSPRRGFGLGLHIVKRFVDLMQGDVGCADNAEGGACFEVRLPLSGHPSREEPEVARQCPDRR